MRQDGKEWIRMACDGCSRDRMGQYSKECDRMKKNTVDKDEIGWDWDRRGWMG